MSILQERFFWSPHFPNQGPHACKARDWPLLPLQPRLLALRTLHRSLLVILWGLHMLFSPAWNILFSPPLLLFQVWNSENFLLGLLWMPPLCQGASPKAYDTWPLQNYPPPPYQNCLGLCILTRLSVLWGQSMPPMLKLYLQYLAQWLMQNRCSVNIYWMSEWASESTVSQASSDTSPNAWFSFATSSSLVKLPSLEQLLLFHSRQNSDADKATYISQRKRNFSKVLRISIW